jgi:signal transduction histidine kinase
MNGGPTPAVVEVAVDSRADESGTPRRPPQVDPPPRATLSDVDIRAALSARPRRSADYAQERRALAELLVELTRDPQTMLQRLAEAALHLCGADSAGLSLLDGEVFRWEAVAGVHAASRHRTIPRAASPCGVCVDEGATQLMRLPDRRFPAVAAEPRFVEVLLVPLYRDGQAVGTLWIVAHTEVRQFDREDESVLRTLSDLAAAALQRSSVYEAAVAANRRKDEFLAMLGHELRNPMAAILAATAVLEKVAAVPEHAVTHAFEVAEHAVTQAFEVLRHQTRHLSRMVDDLNDLSRITQGKLDVRLQTIPLVAAVSDAVSVTRPRMDRRGQHLRVDIPDEPLEVRADQVRLTQLLANLLDNAAKYTPEGGDIRLTVSREDAHARVSVRDNGIGIAGDKLHDIFTLFTQVRPPGGYSEGLGLGLALVERLVTLHGGVVTASSDGPGKGSEFTVRLPVQTVDDSRLVA